MSLSNTFKIKAYALDIGAPDGRTADLANAAEANATISSFVSGSEPAPDNSLEHTLA